MTVVVVKWRGKVEGRGRYSMESEMGRIQCRSRVEVKGEERGRVRSGVSREDRDKDKDRAGERKYGKSGKRRRYGLVSGRRSTVASRSEELSHVTH